MKKEVLQSELKRHERKGELLEAIESFYRRKEILQESINGFTGTFPKLRLSLENRVDTINRCILRLGILYNEV